MRCSCVPRLLRRDCTSALLFVTWLSCPGCTGIRIDKGPTDMVLASNIDGTLFKYREQEVGAFPDEGWVDVGRASKVCVTLHYGKRYELLADPPGYKAKTVRFTEHF